MVQPQWDPYNRNCPTRDLINRLAGRWTVLVIGVLRSGPMRFSEIARAVDGISQKMLTQTLRSLERDGLVTRTVYPEVPPRSEYQLTELGESLGVPLQALEDWATTHMAEVLEARER